MKKLFLAVAMMCGVMTSAHAEDNILDNGIFNHVGASVGVGLTTGIEVEVAAPITNFVQVRAGMSIMPWIGFSGLDFKLDQPSDWNKVSTGMKAISQYSDLATCNGQPLTAEQKNAINEIANMQWPDEINAEAGFKKVDFKLLFDIYPIPNLSFHFTTGFFVGTSEILKVNTTNCGDQLQAITDYNNYLVGNSYSYPGGTLGNLPSATVNFQSNEYGPTGRVASAYLKVNSFKPYLGIGFGRAVPKKTRFAFATDLGVQFWGKPSLYILDQEYGKDNLDDDFVKVMNKVTVYPVISFRLCGRIL